MTTATSTVRTFRPTLNFADNLLITVSLRLRADKSEELVQTLKDRYPDLVARLPAEIADMRALADRLEAEWRDGYGATDTDDWCPECAGTGEQACSCGAWGFADDACQAHPCGDGSPYPLDLREPLPDLLPGIDMWADRQPTEPPF